QPQPGYQAPPGFPAPGYGSGPRPRRRLLPWTIAVAVIAAAVGGYFAQHQISLGAKGGITLPRPLLSLPRAPTAGANGVASNLRNDEATSSRGRLSNIKAGIYGSPTGAWFAVAAGGICGNCYAKSPSVVRKGLVNSGYSNVRAFPAGSKGGSLACGSKL